MKKTIVKSTIVLAAVIFALSALVWKTYLPAIHAPGTLHPIAGITSRGSGLETGENTPASTAPSSADLMPGAQLGNHGLMLHAMLPAVEIITPAAFNRSTSRSVNVTVAATDNGSGVRNIHLLNDGKLIEPRGRSYAIDSTGKHVHKNLYTVPLKKGTNVLTATAENSSHVVSQAGAIEVYYGAGTGSSTLYVLAIGINRYSNKLLTLNFARNDAEAVVHQLMATGNALFKQTEVFALYDGEATSKTVFATLDKIARKAKPSDVFLLYYAGHGSAVGGQYYFVTTENARLYDRDSLRLHAVSAVQLQKKLRTINTRKQVVVIDACQSGAAAKPLIAEHGLPGTTLKRLSAATSIFVLASSGTQEYANEMEKLSHGSFTYALLQGLKGEADTSPKDGKITIHELKAFLERTVPPLARRYSSDTQFPTIASSTGTDFPIASVK